ncbi:MAG: polysaccharide deacetylase family protein [Hyphomicrobiaceae bacterium]
MAFRLLLAVLPFTLAGAAPVRGQLADQACWAPQTLQARPREAEIVKNVAHAYRPVPQPTDRAWSASVAGLRPQAIRRVKLPPGLKLVALTFDLCEQPHEISGYQGDVVDTLRRETVAATFFASGKWLLTHAERAEQLTADPLFELGNHAWEHRNFQVLSPPRMAIEIAAAQQAFTLTRDRISQRACLLPDGRSSTTTAEHRQTLFRFPFGACTREALEAVAAQGLSAIQWDVSSADPWKEQTPDRMAAAVLARVRPGSIVLFHANGRGWHTGAALPRVIAGLRSRGYRFVTVSELLAAGEPETVDTCFDTRPGDTDRYRSLSLRLEAAYDRFYARLGKQRPGDEPR